MSEFGHIEKEDPNNPNHIIPQLPKNNLIEEMENLLKLVFLEEQLCFTYQKML
jgi:hypothetical protein